ncbi:hypothetical protein J4Q44_G00294720, partial [Coregonus suidteri]
MGGEREKDREREEEQIIKQQCIMKSQENRNTYLFTAHTHTHTHTHMFQRVEKVQLNTIFPQHPLVTMRTAVPDGSWSFSQSGAGRGPQCPCAEARHGTLGDSLLALVAMEALVVVGSHSYHYRAVTIHSPSATLAASRALPPSNRKKPISSRRCRSVTTVTSVASSRAESIHWPSRAKHGTELTTANAPDRDTT